MRIGLAVAAIAALISVTPAQAAQGTQGWLHATAGQGQGRVLVAPTAQEHGEFYAQGEVEVEGAPADTAMIVARALYTPGCSSITAQWAPVTTLQTGHGGAGAAHFVRDTPLLSGVTFYVIFRVSGGGTVLESDCITVLVK
ncbi:MAG TPA: hypothetical protein VK606_05620 [Verrucomicrobiae bacterium]|jgi:hypothetical protein|nr:hypothetical protein [Verrucomicrobiae bacterium]